MADPYVTLGVARDADEKAIKSAYRKLAKELHPDRNTGNPRASERFSQVTQAYDLLTDSAKRAAYDRGDIDEQGNPRMPFGYRPGGGTANGPAGGGFEFTDGHVDLGDIFDGLFGGGNSGGRGGPFSGFQRARNAPPARGGNVAYRLTVPFVDAAIGTPQRVTLADGKTIDVKLPPGVETGTQMRIAGKGQVGPGGAGDAIVTLTVADHPFFRHEGDDILLDLPISLDEALNGASVKVPTPDGPVMVKVPAGSSSGRQLRLRGRGFMSKNGKRGDQLVQLMIQLPPDDADLTRRLDGWRDARSLRATLGA